MSSFGFLSSRKGLYLQNRFIGVSTGVDGVVESTKFLFLLVGCVMWAATDYHPVATPIFWFVAGCCLIITIILLLAARRQQYYYF